MTTPKAPMRVLMLCGYLQTASIFSGRLGNLRKAVKGFAELTFIEPPFIIDGDDNPDKEAPPLDTLKPEERPRGWWMMRGEAGRKAYTNFDECLEYVRKVLDEQGPFDAVLGFSQGAGCAAIVAALLEKPTLHPAFATCTHPRFSILFETPCHTPSLHIIGKQDMLVTEDRSLALAKAFTEARIEFHDGGHFIPSKTPWKNFLKEYFLAFATVDDTTVARAAAIPSPTPPVEQAEVEKVVEGTLEVEG
ncbi:hypothetical protein RQP46_001604 [Phenoliferia psychrophenolica]